MSVGKKRTPEFRHRDRIGRGGDKSYGKNADRKIGGPRYLLYYLEKRRGMGERVNERCQCGLTT